MWNRVVKGLALLALFVCMAAVIVPTAAWAASNLWNSLVAPAEWYQTPSLFFRSTTNPAQVIPVMASPGYELPVVVTGGVSITVGSTTFTPSPVFADAGGSGSLALIDSARRSVITIGSDTVGIVPAIASVAAAVTVEPVPPVNGQTNIYHLKSATQQITLMSAPRSIYAFASGSFQAWVGSTTVNASSGDIYSFSDTTGPGGIYMVWTNATPTDLTVFQKGQ